MSEIKFVNLKNLPVLTSDEIASKIKKYKELQDKKDANEKEIARLKECNSCIDTDMDTIYNSMCVFSVEVKYVVGRMLFFDLSHANKVYELLIEKGIPKSNVVLEYTDLCIDDNIFNVNFSIDLSGVQEFVNETYDKWLEEVQMRTPKKTKWDYTDI
jgi:hypothetical protein